MLRPCVVHGCPHLVTRGSRCTEHEIQGKRTRSARRGTRQQRGYDAEWQRTRKLVLARDSYRCQLNMHGCLGKATTVDHVLPKSLGGSDDPTNLVAACHWCNSHKGNRLF